MSALRTRRVPFHLWMITVSLGCHWLASCATATSTAVNAALAATRSAELDAAQLYHEQVVASAAIEAASGDITGAEHARVLTVTNQLRSAMQLASAEQKVYLASGGNLASYDRAFDAMKAARRNVELTWEAVHRE